MKIYNEDAQTIDSLYPKMYLKNTYLIYMTTEYKYHNIQKCAHFYANLRIKRTHLVYCGWGGRIRTYGVLESESSALPLGDTPLLNSLKDNEWIRAVLLWQGWQDSDLRVRKSKSRALPLGDTPVYGVSKETRTLGLQSHNLAL